MLFTNCRRIEKLHKKISFYRSSFLFFVANFFSLCRPSVIGRLIFSVFPRTRQQIFPSFSLGNDYVSFFPFSSSSQYFFYTFGRWLTLIVKFEERAKYGENFQSFETEVEDGKCDENFQRGEKLSFNIFSILGRVSCGVAWFIHSVFCFRPLSKVSVSFVLGCCVVGAVAKKKHIFSRRTTDNFVLVCEQWRDIFVCFYQIKKSLDNDEGEVYRGRHLKVFQYPRIKRSKKFPIVFLWIHYEKQAKLINCQTLVCEKILKIFDDWWMTHFQRFSLEFCWLFRELWEFSVTTAKTFWSFNGM